MNIPADLSIPSFLQRADTPASKAARAALNLELKKGATMSIGPKEQAVRDARLSEADKKAIAELASGQAQKKATQTANRIAKMKAKKNGDAAKLPATGKDALKVIADAAGDAAEAAAAPKATTAKVIIDARTGEPVKPETVGLTKADVKVKVLKAANPAKKEKPKAAKQTKQDLIAGLLKRKQGCTTADVLKACNWPSVSMPQQAKAAGLKLRKEKAKGEPTRYYAA